jgi:hypothetical protein
MKKRNLAGIAEFQKEAARLHALVDRDPAQAVKEARALPSDTPVNGVLFTDLKAAILVDAGSCARDKKAIEDGIALFRGLLRAAS